MPGIAIGNCIPFNRGGVSWSSYWNTLFTGVPYPYSKAPLLTYMSRGIHKIGNKYLLYGEESSAAPLWWISRKTSDDGLRFTGNSAPLLLPGGVGEFDERGQADPCVLYEGPGNWKMWFDALNGSNVWDKIGYATSSDGLSWNKYGSVLERGAAGAWDDNLIHHPCVIKHNGIYYMYYSAVQAPSGVRHQIGLATSPDGITWTKEASNPIIPYGSAGQWDQTYVRPSNPVLIYGTWYMWYWGNDNNVTHAIGLATSIDLIHWTKQGRVLQLGASANWVRLVKGSHPLDIIAQIYYGASGLGIGKATLSSGGTYIDGFTLDIARYGDQVKGTVFTSYAANYIYGAKVTVASAMTPNKIRLHVSATSIPTSGKVKCAIYSDNAGAPDALIAVTEEKDWSEVIPNGWTDFIFSSPPSLAAGDYWLATNSEYQYRRERVVGGSNNWFNKASTYGNFPATITTPSMAGYSGNDIYIVEERNNNVWTVPLVGEPADIYFNGVKGTRVASMELINSQFKWMWNTGVLFIYGGDEHPDIRYAITYT